MSWLPNSWRSGALPAAALLIGLCVAATAALMVHGRLDAEADAEFRNKATRLSADVAQRFLATVPAMNGVSGLYEASGRLERLKFRAYVNSRGIASRLSGVRGIGFIQRVEREGLAGFVAAERVDDAPEFAVRELQDRSHADLYVVKYVEPVSPNAAAMGLDLGSEERRRDGVERAVLRGEPTLSAAITLVQDGKRSPGFLMCLPVYRAGTDPVTPQQRRAALIGLVYAPIVAAELLTDTPGVDDGLLHFELFDTVGISSADSLVFDSDAHPAQPAGAAPASRYDSRHQVVLPVSLAGRDMTLRARSTRKFDVAFASVRPWVIFAIGALISSLIAALLRQLATGRRRAETLAAGMTADLDRLAKVVRHTSNAVSITDRELRFTWINEGFTRITGYAPEDALGKTPGELLGSGKAHPAALQTLADAAASGTGCRVEILNRAKNGREYWIDTEVQPLFDYEGQLTGFMEIGTDITERHHAQARLEAALRDTHALLSTLNLHSIVSVTDRAGRITEVNDAFCRISGYPREELLGQNHAIVNSGEQTSAFWAAMWGTIASGTPWRGAVCNRARDGSLYWVDTLVAPFIGADGRIEKCISICTDITASKNAERVLARERLRLTNILEGTNTGTWEWNVETGECVFNERWAQIAGYTLAELGTTTVDTWTRLAHPEDLSRTAVLLDQHFNGELPTYECEARMRHKDGHWVWVNARGKLYSRSDDGRPRWMAGTHMDISARKQAEAALRTSAALLDRTGRIGGVGGWAFEFATHALTWTDQTCRIHEVEPGHRPDSDEVRGRYPGEARTTLEQAVQRGIDSGESYDLELPLMTAKGRAIWVRVIGVVEHEDGKPARVTGAIQDITARRAMEAELRRGNELLHSVIENLPCGLSVFDAELKLVAVNAEFRRLLDLPDHLFEGATTRFEDIIRFNAARGEYGSGGLEATVQAIVDRARAPGTSHQFERVRPDGTPLEVRGAPMPAGGFVTTYTDISARKRAEAEVQRSAQLLRGAIDTIDEAFVLFDPEDRLVLCNQQHRDLYVLNADMLVPGNTFEQIVRAGAERGHHEAAIGRIDEWVAERLATHRQPSSRLIQRLGDGRVLRIVERRMIDGHAVGFRVDITELVHATEAAQEASRSKSQFLANMSHEIRTPMNAILGMLALLRKTELTTRQADYASKTEGAARSLLGLLNDILDFSKVEAGKMTLDPNPFRIDQLLRDLSVILSANVGAKPVEVLFDIDPALPRHLVGDAMRLQQVLINLGGNAIKFTAQGEVVVSMAVVAREANAVTVEIAVRDTGIGIAPENQARIFSGFTQAEASTTRRFGGTGLGVAISQRLVGLMGAELKLDSALGQGSRFHFRITLPVVAVDAQDSAEDSCNDHPRDAARPAIAAPAAPLRALVIDDNPTAREVLERMCLSLGWGVDTADSGAAALALLQARAAGGVAYQAVFIDWQMPGLDGWQTSQRIRALGLTGDAPVVVMVTAHGREMLAQRSEAEQALLDGFLVKPVTASMLFDAVVDARSEREQPHPSRGVRASAEHRLAGLHLLVVEDNLNNQQVARELLEGEGAIVQIANHGQEAVEAVAAAAPPFDVVLMDLQMPVMDGFTATRRIRHDLGLPTLPIVAMTANAMASDREACLAAGMNDHVGKPFDLDHLVRVLRKHAGRQVAPERAAVAAAALPAAVLHAAAAAGVDIDATLNRLGGEREVYQRMLRTFVRDLAAMPAQLQAQAAQGDALSASQWLHTLKGLAATLGIAALSADAAQGEKQLAGGAARDDAADAVARACAPVIEAIKAAGPGLAALLQALQATDPEPAPVGAAPMLTLDTDAFLAALGALTEQLGNADMAATDTFGELRRQFGVVFGERLGPIDETIGALDFERALRLCDELRHELGSGLNLALALAQDATR